MSNMSYCRFQNTLGDLIDCQEALAEDKRLSEASQAEKNAARTLITVCREIASEYEDEDLVDVFPFPRRTR